MRIECASGLHGELVEYRHMFYDYGNAVGIAIVRRDDATVGAAPYSTHVLYEDGGRLCAQSGHYDLTLEDARRDFGARVGRAAA